MDKFSYISNANGAYIEDLYTQYKENPDQVDSLWQKFFEGYEFSQVGGAAGETVSDKEVSVMKLIHAYRSRGHLIAKTNPVRDRRHHKSDLSLDYFGLSEADLNEEFDAGKEIAIGRATLKQILAHLEATYCSSIGVEFMYCQDEKLRQWLYKEMEPRANTPKFSKDEKLHILDKINKAVSFENFLQMKFVGKKRFSLEGLEALIPSLDVAVNLGSKMGVQEFVLGMAHRGRLNVLVNVFQKTYETVFSEFDETPLADTHWAGDVKYHLGQSADIVTANGKKVHLSLLPNPSHLEAVNPVVQGLCYAKCRDHYKGDPKQIMPILIHGDAAVAGQGVNYEMVNMSQLEGYGIGGTIHIVLNNQIGFTADYKEARSSVYCTDIAKVTESPVFHVNADDPEAVAYVVEMAVKIREKFGIDVYVDILGYRRYGHNEGDEPRFTQPELYRSIDKHPNVYNLFLEKLVADKVITESEAKSKTNLFKQSLQESLEVVREKKDGLGVDLFKRNWTRYREATQKDIDKSVDTGVSDKVLTKIAKSIFSEPTDVSLFAKMKKLLKQRYAMFMDKGQADWAVAEALAYGSLVLEEHPVRLSGQDCQRGTFSHRHAVIKDFESESLYTPINNIQKKQSRFQVLNSHLAEYSVMGFEYGYTWASPKSLVIWEAQFGDFSNGAQIIIDQFLCAAATKWQRMSGLTLMLPHGHEGQGPEHSSARPERYLQLCAENNMYMVNATTPANLFHALRRQVHNPFRIPLVIFTPKSLLRHPKVVSDKSDLINGRFQEILDDDRVTAKSVTRVVLCTGKVYYDLLAEAEESRVTHVALVRIEQLYPLSQKQLTALKAKYKHVKDWAWVQEEPENMGAWSHIMRHLSAFNLRCISRPACGSPAGGNSKHHQKVQAELVKSALKK
ncbi:2-oxoglutarate dehydrogenase E1 component [bacterium]|jgi:2-oxoglutarate dehydrogenase E1 component|nr:2-oxoglutarate dehydrogenase E1 component [bacterium]